MRNQQPATATLFEMMQPVACGCLRKLADGEARVIVYDPVKHFVRPHFLHRSIAIHSKSYTRDLHYRL